MWDMLNADLIFPQNFLELKQEVLATLREPLLPAPSLRREAFSFPTVIQDLIGNSMVPPSGFEMPYFCPALEALRDNIEVLEENFMDCYQVNQLSGIRWMLRNKNENLCGNRGSLASQSTSAENERNSSVMVCLMKAIKATVKVHCKAVRGLLSKFTEPLSLLSAYCIQVITK